MRDCVAATLDDCYTLVTGNEANNIYSQGWYGELTVSGNLKLDPFETVILAERNRIEIFDDEQNSLALSDVVARFSEIISDFLSHYLLYKDLRTRGYVIKKHTPTSRYFLLYERGASPNKKEEYVFALILPMTEGILFNVNEIDQVVSKAKNLDLKLIFAVIDSLGDVSYYSVKELTFQFNQNNIRRCKK